MLIGVGQPFWGNAPLDALQQGLMVLLPRFRPPIGSCEECVTHMAGQPADSKDSQFLKTKFQNMPNRLPLTSQNPYIESLGQPDVWMLPLDAHTDNTSTVANQLAAVRAARESSAKCTVDPSLTRRCCACCRRMRSLTSGWRSRRRRRAARQARGRSSHRGCQRCGCRRPLCKGAEQAGLPSHGPALPASLSAQRVSDLASALGAGSRRR